MAGSLDGVRVVSVCQWAAVPGACTIMADFGADVIHIENPKRG